MGRKRTEIKRKKDAQRILNPSGRLFSLKQAIEYLGPGMSLWGLRERIWAGQIPYVQFQPGGKMLVDRCDLDQFIDRHKKIMR